MSSHGLFGWMVTGFLIGLAGCSAAPTVFHPINPITPGEFSHRDYDGALRHHVKHGIVDYPGLQKDTRLTNYLTRLDRVDPTGFVSRNEKLAFWINAYNAFAIKGILNRYSPTSHVGRYRYFIGQQFRVGGETINLYDLERQVLIAQFHEPLIHFAIVCASTSCPPLQPWAYDPGQLDRQLDLVAREFINDESRNRFDRRGKIASLSMIFKWFEKDFSMVAGSVLDYVARYVEDPNLAKELMESGYRVEYLDYDWTLNGIPPKE